MKTSNKILLAFLIVVLLVPVGSLLALRAKITNSNYTLVRHDIIQPPMIAVPADFHVVHINSVDSVNTCKLIPSKAGYFTFKKDDIKYVFSIFRKDTLFIKYGRQNDGHVTPIGIPDLSNVIVDGTNVHIDDLQGFVKPDIQIQLNDASLRLEDESKPVFRNITLIASNSHVELVKASPINQLTLQSFRTSSFVIGNSIQIQSINAQFSPDTHVAANWDFFQRIHSLK